jgi:uncharacterized membrane protein YqjE
VIKESIAKFLRLDGIMSNLTGYIEARIELMKIEVTEDLAKAISRAAVYLLIGLASMFFILFISIAVAFKIGESTSLFTGFSVVACFYVVIGGALWLSREVVRKKVEHQMIENIKHKKK